MISVAIFEGNKHLRETLKLIIDASDKYLCCGAYANCDNIIEKLPNATCDIVLMDIEMPGMNGIGATKLIRNHFPQILVLIQTVFSEDEYIFEAICAGASGYILKSASSSGYL